MTNYELELTRLFALEARTCDDLYLHGHSRNAAVIARQVSIFERCKDVLMDAHTILDWGCRHAVAACMARMLRGKDDVEIHGCDVDAGEYHTFYDFANLKYSQLTHPYLLPYEDSSFDAVLASGVLEHVPNDSESLKELYRIIRPGGHFIVTFLPNRYSYTEWLSRKLNKSHHLRVYSLSEARHMLMHHGFLPISFGYHQMLPTFSGNSGGVFDNPAINKLVGQAFRLNPVLERLWPLNRLASNVFIVAQKAVRF